MAYKALERRLKFLIASYRRHGAAHVVEVFRQARVRRRYAKRTHALPSTEKLVASFPFGADTTAFLSSFDRTRSLLLPGATGRGKEFGVGLLLSIRPHDALIDDADLISEGRFPALGLCIDERGGGIDWCRDYSSGRSWPSLPYHAITFMGGDGSDVKYVWEPSRFYWVGWLGNAWRATGNGVWCRAFLSLVDSWREQNPFAVGVNWAMPMEIAIRGFWLMLGYSLFRGSPSIPPAWWMEYLRLAWGHASHLENNLEYFSNLTNHYLSNCFGLLALGLLFRGSAEGDRWFTEGRRRMIEELGHQVTRDGVHYERSIGYHGLVLEMYLVAILLAERGGAPFPPDARGRVERMAEFCRDYTPRAGGAPQLGDSDDGRILRLAADQDLYDHRDLLALAAVLFNREDLAAAAGGYSLAAFMMTGAEGFERYRALERGSDRRVSTLYRDGGFAALRSEELFAFADVGEIGLHGNNDTLSYTLHVASGAILVDPGTYCYTRDVAIRNALRSTAAHNAPAIGDREIAPFDGLWRVAYDRTAVAIDEWRSDGGVTLLAARHHGYRDLPGHPVMLRRWELRAGTLTVRDTVEASSPIRTTTRFTLPGECSVRALGETSVEILRPEGDGVRLECSHPVAISRGWYSPSYGVAAPAVWLDVAGEPEPPSGILYIWRSL